MVSLNWGQVAMLFKKETLELQENMVNVGLKVLYIISNARMWTRHELPGEQQVQRSSIAVQ